MSNPFIGEIRMGGWNFAPRGWAYCDGQVVPIAGLDPLFALIGTTYGGDGATTFGLPDLRGRTPYSRSSPFGTFVMGDRFGAETVAISTNELPSHTHVAAAVAGPAVANPSTSPTFKLPSGQANQADPPYGDAPANTSMSVGAISATGGSQPHDNIQPVLAINFAIALEGVFPSRN